VAIVGLLFANMGYVFLLWVVLSIPFVGLIFFVGIIYIGGKLTDNKFGVIVGRGCRQVSLHHVGDVGRAGEDPAKGGVLLQESNKLDARDSRCVFLPF